MPVINGVYLKDFPALPSSVADANIIPIAISGNQIAYRTTVAGIVTDARVTSKLLTGLSVTGSTILATDTILQAFGKVQNQLNGKVTSVGLTMPAAFNVANSPITSAGTLAVTAAGVASQYIRGDGALADFPTRTGGGSSVSYYLNGSVNQGTFVGNTYYEMNKTPVIGAGTDFSIGADGYIAQFITDANDPASLLIPGGNWNVEMYFSASSSGGTPSFYVEVYKYDGSTFTLLGTSSATPEGITNGTAIDIYYTSVGIPETVLTITDRLAIRVYVTHSGRTITLHTEDNHLSEIVTTFSNGLTTLNGLTKQSQYFAVGSTGTDFAIVSSVDTHTFNLPTASASNRGALSSANWTTFNNKQDALSGTGIVKSTAGVITYLTDPLPIANGGTGSATQNFVDLTTNQSIAGGKTFTSQGNFQAGLGVVNNSFGATSLSVSSSGLQSTGVLGNADYYGIKGIGNVAGVYGVITSATGSAINGEATTGYAGYFFNSSASNPTIYARNTNASGILLQLQGITGNTVFSVANSGALTGTTATFTNSGAGIGIDVTNSGSGDGIKITHSLGRAFRIESSSTGYGILINNLTASTSAPFTIQKQGSNVITMSDTGAANFTGQLTLGSTITNGTYTYTLPSATGTLALVGGAGVGTVTSVAALTLGTTGTDLSSTVANGTTTPVITLNVPTASATNRGALSSTDWSTFNSKESALTFSSPLVRTTNTISIPAATTSVNGYLTSTDWTTFNGKQGTITLTTTGTSGAATFSSNTLNIPNYGSALSGYLPLTGGTLTGALSGTSATFSSTVTVSNADPLTYLQLANTSSGGQTYTLISAGVSNPHSEAVGTFYIRNSSTSTTPFRIASTGAATFSSSVTATTGLTVGSLGSGSDAIITLATNASGSPRTIYYKASTASVNFTSTAAADIMMLSNGGVLTINNLGTGTVQATAGVLSVISDSKAKDKTGLFEGSALKAINKIEKPQYWNYNAKSELGESTYSVKQFGLFADDIHKALGEEFAPTQTQSVYNEKTKETKVQPILIDGSISYSMSDRALLSLAIQAIQELKAEIDLLKGEPIIPTDNNLE